MRADIQALIQKLSAERDSIDRSLTALRAALKAGQAAPVAAALRPRQRRTRVEVPRWKKELIVQAMSEAEDGTRAALAKVLSIKYGVKFNSIASLWRDWAAHLSETATPSEPESMPMAPTGTEG